MRSVCERNDSIQCLVDVTVNTIKGKMTRLNKQLNNVENSGAGK